MEKGRSWPKSRKNWGTNLLRRTDWGTFEHRWNNKWNFWAECRKEAEAEPAAREPKRRKPMMFRLEGNFSGNRHNLPIAGARRRVPVFRGTPGHFLQYLATYFLSIQPSVAAKPV